MKKKLIAFLLAAGLSASMLAGCGASGSSSQSGPVNSKTEADSKEDDKKEDAQKEDTSKEDTQTEDAQTDDAQPIEAEVDTELANSEETETEDSEAEEERTADDILAESEKEGIPGRPDATAGTGEIKVLDIGDVAPDFTVELVNGETFTLSDYDDGVVLVNFWATWCGPCVGEMPDFEKLYQDNIENFAIIGVNCMEDSWTVDDFYADNGFTFNVAYDVYGKVADYYPSDYIPYTLIVKHGYIEDIIVGAPYDAYSEYKEKILSALND